MRFSLGSAALVLALAGSIGCARRLDPHAEPGALLVNLNRAGGIEIVVEEDELVNAAARCADRWRRARACEVVLVRAGDARHADWARVVIGSAKSGEARELALALGFLESQPEKGPARGSFHVLARTFAHLGDHLVACFGDPAREGLPVTLAFCVDPRALESTLNEVWPGARPWLHVYEQGALSLDAALDIDGRVRAATVVDHEPARLVHPERYADQRLEAGGLAAGFDRSIPVERVTAYLAAVHESRTRAASWTGAKLEPLALTLAGNVEDFAPAGRRGVTSELARACPFPPVLEALLAPGLPDDGGAAAAELHCVASLGDAAHEWMREGSGVDAAGTWWGRDLVEWCQALAFLEAPPSLEEIVAEGACELSSPHLIGPLRGLLFRALRESLGAERLRRAWTGAEDVDARELGAVFQKRFPLVDLGARDRVVERRKARTEHALDPARSWFGAYLVAPPERGLTGQGSRAALAALDELASAGARAIAVESFATLWWDTWSGWAWEGAHRLGALEGDVGIAATLAAAREHGLATALVPGLLSGPAGALAGDTVRTNPEQAEAFFDDYERFVTHYALLAELVEADLLVLGSSIPEATRVEGPKPEMNGIYAANHEGWRRIVRRARQLYSGALTFSAGSPAQLAEIDFWDALDFRAVQLSPSLSARERGTDRLDEQLSGWLAKTLADLEPATGPPLLVTRIGFRSTQRAATGPLTGGGPADPLVQARLYHGLFVALERARASGTTPRGLFLFSWPIDPAATGSTDRGFGTRGKPASQWLGAIFGR